MYIKNKISIVVVTYHNDFVLLDRLLRSIQQYWEINDIEEIIIILNDSTKYLEHLKKHPLGDEYFKILNKQEQEHEKQKSKTLKYKR